MTSLSFFLFFMHSVPEHKKIVMSLTKKISMLDKLHSSVSYSVVDCEFNVKQLQCILNKMPLNKIKHTHTHIQVLID